MNNFQQVEKIIGEIKSAKNEDAIVSFDVLLSSIPDNSVYSGWSSEWIKKIYEFGTLFVTENPELYFREIEKFREKNEAKSEVVEFIYSEIAWNYFSNDRTYIRNQLKDLKRKYPLNPEFYHSYSHILYEDGCYKESLQLLEQAIRIDPCDRFVNTYINRVRYAFNSCISKNHMKSAEIVLDNADKIFGVISNRGRYIIYINMLPALRDRLNDHKVIAEKISKIDDIISKRTESLRNRFISMLGVFAAIIAFILTTVNLAISNLNVKDIMLLMIAMADVLIIFVLCIDYVFYIRRNRRTFFEFLGDKQFWGIIGLLLLLYAVFNIK